MSTQTRDTYQACNAAVDAKVALMDKLEFLTGSAPAQPDNSTSETVLGRVNLGTFDAAVNGATSYTFSNVAVLADGTIDWWRTVDSGGNPVSDGPVYQAGDTPITGGIELSRLAVTTADLLSGTFTYQDPKVAT